MNISELELQEILKNNTSIKVHNFKRLEPNEYLELQKSKITTSKYRNKKTKVDGVVFDSKKESETFAELETLLRAGQIAGYCRQAQFILQKGDIERKPITYLADWIIFKIDGTFEIREDKGFMTEVYRIKKKMFQERFPKLKLNEKF